MKVCTVKNEPIGSEDASMEVTVPGDCVKDDCFESAGVDSKETSKPNDSATKKEGKPKAHIVKEESTDSVQAKSEPKGVTVKEEKPTSDDVKEESTAIVQVKPDPVKKGIEKPSSSAKGKKAKPDPDDSDKDRNDKEKPSIDAEDDPDADVIDDAETKGKGKRKSKRNKTDAKTTKKQDADAEEDPDADVDDAESKAKGKRKSKQNKKRSADEAGADTEQAPKGKKLRVNPEKVKEVRGKIVDELTKNYKFGMTEMPLDTLAASVGYKNFRSDAIQDALKQLTSDGLVEKSKASCKFTEKGIKENVPEDEPVASPEEALERYWNHFEMKLSSSPKGAGEKVLTAAKAVWDELKGGGAYTSKQLVGFTDYKGTNSTGYEQIMKALKDLNFVDKVEGNKFAFSDKLFPFGRP